MTAERVDLTHLFAGLQDQLRSKLRSASAITHAPSMGATSEADWIGMLAEYLPQRYTCTSGFVVDSTGERSDQIDIVIYDRHFSPFLFRQDSVLYVPAESVYAVFEVKQEADAKNIRYAAAKAESVRRLHRTSAEIVHAGGVFPPKDHHRILAGILTLRGSWKEPLGPMLQKTLDGLSEQGRLDLGCFLLDGAFDQDTDATARSSRENALIFFFLRLLARLQSIGTVAALDVEAYAKAIR